MNDLKQKSVWKIPDLLMSFLSNLPIELYGITPYNRSWTVRKTFQMLNLKFNNDKEDMDMGSGVQVRFLLIYR